MAARLGPAPLVTEYKSFDKHLNEKQIATPYFIAGNLLGFGRALAINFAKDSSHGDNYYLVSEIMFAEPILTSKNDSLVVEFKDNTRLKLLHGFEHANPKEGFLYVTVHSSIHTFRLSDGQVRMLAEKTAKRITLYFTGRTGLTFEKFPDRKRRRYESVAGTKTYPIKRLNKRSRRQLKSRARCILEGESLKDFVSEQNR